MAKEGLSSKKKAYLYLGVLLLFLVLLGLFVYFYDKALWHVPLHQGSLARPLEIIIILVGLALDSLGGAFGLFRMWKGQPKSFVYDIGLRLLITGYLVAFISAMADYFGVGAHHILPYFGPLQAAGVFLGEGVIAVGFLMMFPYKLPQKGV
ncbi:MAG: hypothetical protein ABSG01_16495 [Anaerolineales bacterium]|jgi:hypothetical protein